MDNDDALLSSRGSQTTELRGQCPLHVVNLLDAVAVARDCTRTDLVNEILGEWAKNKSHEHTLIARVLRGNPTTPELSGALGGR